MTFELKRICHNLIVHRLSPFRHTPGHLFDLKFCLGWCCLDLLSKFSYGHCTVKSVFHYCCEVWLCVMKDCTLT